MVSPPGARATLRAEFHNVQRGSSRNSSKGFPVHAPTSISLTASATSTPSPKCRAIGSAVSRARSRGLACTAATVSRDSRAASLSACARPSAPSFTPGMRPHSALPTRSWAAWRTRNNVVTAASVMGLAIPGDETERALARLRVGELLRRRLHEVARRPDERAADAAVLRELGAAHRVDHDPCGIRRIPHLELELDVEGHAAESRAFHADVGPLAVSQPRHVIARADVDVFRRHGHVELARHGARLRDLLRLEALALEHILEVGVAAEVELIGAVEPHAALAEEIGEHAMDDRRADLALDVVADDREVAVLELPPPGRVGGDEDGDAVHERAAGLERPLRVELSRLLRSDRKIGHDDVGAGPAEHLGDVGLALLRLRDLVAQILAQPVEGPAAVDDRAGLGRRRK